MNRVILFLSGGIFAFCFAIESSQAAVIFDSSFTSGEGFTNGDIHFGGVNPDTIVGQFGYTISDSAGTGTLSVAGGAFQRAVFGLNPSGGKPILPEATVLGLTPSNIIVLEAFQLTFTPGGANIAVFGLANTDSSNLTGNTSLAMGGQFTWNGSTLFLDRNVDFSPNFDVNTGIGPGTAFDYRQVIKPVGGGLFNIDHHINGSLLTTTLGASPNFGKSGLNTAGIIQDLGAPGSISVDRLTFSLEVAPVPEPSSLLLSFFALLTATVAIRKRNFG